VSDSGAPYITSAGSDAAMTFWYTAIGSQGTEVYIVAGLNIPHQLYQGGTIRVGEQAGTGSALIGKTLGEVDLLLARSTTNTTGTVTVNIRKASDDSIAATMGTLDVSTLPTSGFKQCNFVNNNNTYAIVLNDKVVVEYSGGDSTNYVKVDLGSTYDTTKSYSTYFAPGPPTPNPPVVNNVSVNAVTATPTICTFSGTDNYPAPDKLTYALATNPTHGALTLLTATNVTYTSVAAYVGSDSFTYYATDGHGQVSGIGTVTVTVAAGAPPPPPPTPPPPPPPPVGGQNVKVYSQVSTNTPNHLSSNSGDYDRAGEICQTGSVLIGKVLTQVQVWMRKSSGATGNANCVIRKGTDGSGITMGTIDVSTLDTSMQLVSFTNNANSYALAVNDKILIEYNASSNYIAVDESNSGTVDGTKTCAIRHTASGGYGSPNTSNDLSATMWTA